MDIEYLLTPQNLLEAVLVMVGKRDTGSFPKPMQTLHLKPVGNLQYLLTAKKMWKCAS